MRTFSTIRAAFVLLLVVGAMGLLLGRVVYLQTYGREQTIRRADRQQHFTQTLESRRGCIFDANGLMMAGTIQSQAVFVDPKFMHEVFADEGRSLIELDQKITELAHIIDRDPFELSQILSERFESRFIKLAERLGPQACQAIRDLDLPGVGLMPMHERYYPMGSLAAHILGAVGREGNGLEGIELRYDQTLSGKPGYKRALKDSRRRSIAVAEEDYLPPQHGQHLILTIDANIQMIVQQELAATCEQFRADRGEAVVMDPRTGDVLAMANWPTFNPQNLEDSSAEIRRNRCLTDPYEPGSTIKPFIVGPAIASKITRPGEVWPVEGKTYKSSLRRKLVSDVTHYGAISTWDVLVKSSNIGMVMLAERLGKNGVWRALNGFGFGEPTGIGLPGEDPGRLTPVSDWGTTDVVSAVQGYYAMVTPLQLARGFCAYANGGRLVTPRIVKGVLDEAGQVVSHSPPKALNMLPEVVDPVTAAEVKRILSDVPVRGSATKAHSESWNIFGKTGTAHVAKNGSYNETAYTSSFLAGAPAEDPRIVVAFIIHEPDRDWVISQGLMYYGGSIAAPGAKNVIERSLAYLQVPASPPLPLPPAHIESVLVRYDRKSYMRLTGNAATASARD